MFKQCHPFCHREHSHTEIKHIEREFWDCLSNWHFNLNYWILYDIFLHQLLHILDYFRSVSMCKEWGRGGVSNNSLWLELWCKKSIHYYIQSDKMHDQDLQNLISTTLKNPSPAPYHTIVCFVLLCYCNIKNNWIPVLVREPSTMSKSQATIWLGCNTSASNGSKNKK